MHRRRPAIAVVDDDPRVTESLEDLLESAGYAVCCFSSAEALLACDLSDVDVLITDIGLPNVDGLQLRNIVMRRRPGLPVFLITGRHEIADQTRAKGITGFFRKPFDGAALLSAIDEAVGAQTNRGTDHE
ncbi:response regulator transcription factor [Tardiphaga sp. 813_E8_N1_3]|uniref:response regulator transcription factor n=1 Tax=Tardiphaga sp. 813_E8_N1_3 TaxID=3240760 RepID=UPI003F232604